MRLVHLRKPWVRKTLSNHSEDQNGIAAVFHHKSRGNVVKEKLEQRLNALRDEFEQGQKILAELEARQTNVRSTLLRISGAIQVLEEELGQTAARGGDASRIGLSAGLDAATQLT